MKKILFLSLALAVSTPFLNSCRDSDLGSTLAQDKEISNAINNVEDLRSILNSAYNRMSDYRYYGRDYIIDGEVRSDNAYSNANSNRFVTVGQMQMVNTDSYASDAWTQMYAVIASTNIVINADQNKISGSKEEINQIIGEALAVRALVHFDLLKLFGQQSVGAGGMTALGIPYATTFGVSENFLPKRNSVQEVYDMAMADLNKAISLMTRAGDNGAHYLSSYGAQAVKARLALYFGKYDVAKEAAGKVINGGEFSIASAADFAKTFNTDETPNQIFSIANSSNDNQSTNGIANIYRGSYGDIVFLDDLYQKFTDNDVRKKMFSVLNAGISYRNVGKYPTANSVDDIPVIRYEEMVLIYAEALLNTGDAAGALTYLNMIPTNRGAAAYTSATMDNILLERRKEFAAEGFRFYDLARTKQSMPLVSILQTYGNVPYGSYKYAFPIPLAEMSANSNMVQNQNY